MLECSRVPVVKKRGMKSLVLIVRFSVFLLLANFASAGEHAPKDQKARPTTNGWFYGLALGYSESIYIGKGGQFTPIPAIGYIGENWRITGPVWSYDAFTYHDLRVSLRAAVRFDGYDADDSSVFSGMEDRERSIDGGVDVHYGFGDRWAVSLSYMHDVLSRHKGAESSLGLSKKLRKGPFVFTPSISGHYMNARLVDYYYGVESDEVSASRSVYEGEGALNYRMGFSVATPILLGGLTKLDITQTWYADEVRNSPLVDQDRSTSARLTYTRFF